MIPYGLLRWYVAWLTQVPGVTLPWTDMVPLLAAVALGQAWHEAGHALAAAWHHLRPMHLGVSLLCPGVPVAHVALPSLRALRLPHQLRVISAGVTHNALLLGLCALVYGVGSAAQKDARGLYVVRVDDAAMRASMPPDTTIVQLNDVDLSMLAPSARWDVWSALQQGTLASDLGWCVSRGDWAAAPASCAPPALDATCFVQVEAPHAPRALEPLAVLGPAARCRGAEDCASPGGVCVLVSGDLTPTARVYLGTSASTDLVLLRGPFDALGALVHVTPMRLRGPAWLRAARVRRVAELVEWPLRYVSVVNMTLLLGNMLPLPFLDGGAYLHVLLRWWMGADDVDAWSLDDAGHALELDLECAAAPAPSSGDIERVLRYVLYGTCALCVAAALGSAWATWRVG